MAILFRSGRNCRGEQTPEAMPSQLPTMYGEPTTRTPSTRKSPSLGDRCLLPLSISLAQARGFPPPNGRRARPPRRLGPGGDRRPANAVAISVTRVAYPRRRQMFVLAREGDQPLRPPHALPILHRPPLHPPKHATTVDGQSRGCLNWGSKEIPTNRQKVRRRDHSPTCVSRASPFGPIMIRAPLTLTISMQDQLSPRRANARTRRKPEPRLPSREQEQRKPKDKLKCR